MNSRDFRARQKPKYDGDNLMDVGSTFHAHAAAIGKARIIQCGSWSWLHRQCWGRTGLQVSYCLKGILWSTLRSVKGIPPTHGTLTVCFSALGVSAIMHYINWRFTYLLTNDKIWHRTSDVGSQTGMVMVDCCEENDCDDGGSDASGDHHHLHHYNHHHR